MQCICPQDFWSIIDRCTHRMLSFCDFSLAEKFDDDTEMVSVIAIPFTDRSFTDSDDCGDAVHLIYCLHDRGFADSDDCGDAFCRIHFLHTGASKRGGGKGEKCADSIGGGSHHIITGDCSL